MIILTSYLLNFSSNKSIALKTLLRTTTAMFRLLLPLLYLLTLVTLTHSATPNDPLREATEPYKIVRGEDKLFL